MIPWVTFFSNNLTRLWLKSLIYLKILECIYIQVHLRFERVCNKNLLIHQTQKLQKPPNHHIPAKQLQENLDGQRWIWALQKRTCCIRVFNTTHRCIMPSQNIFLIVAENKPETLTHILKQWKIMPPKS